MSRTPILSAPQVLSGPVPPTAATPPEDPQSAAQFHVIVGGAFVGEYTWDVGTQTWLSVPQGTGNWSEFPACGWQGKHSRPHMGDPSYTDIGNVATWVPVFGSDAPSLSPVPFMLMEKLTAAVLATGELPANARTGDATTCSLLDATSNPVTTISVTPGMQIAAVPVGGHTAMPADGHGFSAAGRLVY